MDRGEGWPKNWLMTSNAGHILTPAQRTALASILRARKADGLKVWRANALLLLDDGLDPADVARVLYLDVGTIWLWQRHFASDGAASLDLNGYSRRVGQSEPGAGSRIDGIVSSASAAHDGRSSGRDCREIRR